MENVGIAATLAVLLTVVTGILVLVSFPAITISGAAAAGIVLGVALVVGFVMFHVGRES